MGAIGDLPLPLLINPLLSAVQNCKQKNQTDTEEDHMIVIKITLEDLRDLNPEDAMDD